MTEPSSKPTPSPTVGTTGEMRVLGAGTQLGRYTLLRRVAAGGMAEVYAARSQGISGFEKKVAIKKILPQHSLNKRFVDMLVDEAKITVSLAHPNIAQIYELGLDDETYYMVMEFVEGRPLNRLLQKVDARGHRTMPIEHAVHIVAETMKGLQHAHLQKDPRGKPLGIVHRDVSPQNIMVAYSGDVKLIDFGIARAQGRAAQTTVGTIKGKLRYLAPEIAVGLEPDHRADIFCGGIVLFELLTGEAMFAPRTDVEAIEMASEARVRSPRGQNPSVPKELDDIVMKALAREREERFQSAKELYTELRRFLNQYFPAYVGSELGDYMHAMFAAELEEDRRLDGLAEQVVQKRASLPPPNAPPLATGEIGKAEGTKSGGYRELVTRSEIELVRPVAADDDDGEMPGAAIAPATRETPGSTKPAATPEEPETVLETSQKTAETIARPPTSPKVSAVPPRPAAGKVPAALLAGVFLFGLGGFFLLRSTRGGGEETPGAASSAGPLGLEPARLTIDVSPSVPVRVTVDGQLQGEDVRPPVKVVLKVAELKKVSIGIESDGYLPAVVERSVSPGNETVLKVELTPGMAEIELSGALNNAKIETDVGKVEGTKITGLEYGQTVHLRVERPGAVPWETTAIVEQKGALKVEVPAAVMRQKGRLVVRSRPFSDVFVDGRALGRTPVDAPLYPGGYTIALKREGRTETRRVTISPGQTSEIMFQWPP
ncbi:MAG: serine/threonine-protein kinase [Myxococcota bacterium]